MTEIKFARNYGLAPAAPFWLVWNEDGFMPRFKHPNLSSAEAEAARLASENPGTAFHVLGVLSTITTSAEIVGTRFDPMRDPPVPVEEIAPPPPPVEAFPVAAFLAEDDGQPF